LFVTEETILPAGPTILAARNATEIKATITDTNNLTRVILQEWVMTEQWLGMSLKKKP
jgi:hypothetical protein